MVSPIISLLPFQLHRYNMQRFYQLDQLIQGYFNQDFDSINYGEDTIEGITRLFIHSASKSTLEELVEEIDDFVDSYKANLEEEFKSRYGFDFSPELWETTAYDFLMTLRRLSLSGV